MRGAGAGACGCAGSSAGGATGRATGGTDAGGSGASANGPISVYSREDGSGTRSAFVELLGIEQADANGDKVDMTHPSAAITNSTAVMMTSVAGDPNAIGYISLGSLDDTVKAVSIDGVAPSAAAVKDGSYAIARPFNVVTKGGSVRPGRRFLRVHHERRRSGRGERQQLHRHRRCGRPLRFQRRQWESGRGWIFVGHAGHGGSWPRPSRRLTLR